MKDQNAIPHMKRGMELAIQIEWHKLIYGSSLRCNGGVLRKHPLHVQERCKQAAEKVRQQRSRIVQILNVPQGYASGLHSLRPFWTAFLSSLRDRAHVALAVRTFDVRACQHSFSADCERSGLPWTTPLLLICAGLAWAHTVQKPDRIGWSVDVITDHPRCPPLALELEYHAKAPSPLKFYKADYTGAASVPVALKRTIVGCTSEA